MPRSQEPAQISVRTNPILLFHNSPSPLLLSPLGSLQALTHIPQVIVGAHYDSTGGSSTARGPGADDNGSGVVTILEALRVIAASGFKPKNTLEFHFYAGEEGGLLGSQAVFANYASTGKTVLAVVAQGMSIVFCLVRGVRRGC